MGYATKPELVTENQALLESIKTAVAQGKQLRISTESGEVDTEQWRLRRILAATDRHPSVLRGAFAGLGKRVSLRVEDEKTIIVKPRGQKSSSMKVHQASEVDELSRLDEYKGDLEIVSFHPSEEFTEDRFEAALSSKGWTLHRSTREEKPDGTVTYAVERDVSSGFDQLQ